MSRTPLHELLSTILDGQAEIARALGRVERDLGEIKTSVDTLIENGRVLTKRVSGLELRTDRFEESHTGL